MRLAKWHGLGNDYLLVERAELDCAARRRSASALLCDYHVGVGSDGILEVARRRRRRGGAHDLEPGRLDGRALRQRHADRRALARAPQPARDEVARARRRRARSRATDARRRARPHGHGPGRRSVRRSGSTLDGETLEFTPVSVGNPHAVIRREPDRARPAPARARSSSGTRASRSGRTSSSSRVDGPHALRVGVWERGAGETRSSGTSSVAAAAAAVANGWCESPVTVTLAGGVARGRARRTAAHAHRRGAGDLHRRALARARALERPPRPLASGRRSSRAPAPTRP